MIRQQPMVRQLRAGLVLGAAALLLSGCGSSSPASTGDAIARPVVPKAKECIVKHQPGTVGNAGRSRAANESPPKAGTYTYIAKGTQAIPEQAVRVKNLPHRSKLVVTPARGRAYESCFRVQTRIASNLAITRTYVINGGDIYLVSVATDALGESQEVRPIPPVLSATKSASRWSGRFAGPTYGAYTFSTLGKRTFQIGGTSIRAVGIASSVSYRGAFTGTQVATTWIALEEKLVVAERLRSQQQFGASTLKLHSASRLTSLSGKPWISHE